MTDATVADHRTPRLQLAIETTGRCGSIAILRGQEILETINLPETTRTAASLAVHLDDILQQHRDGTRTIELVSVADGPGSFTGLRIGVTTAKSLCYALKVPLVAVDSLAAVAAAVFHEHPSANAVCVGLDAYRQQVFAGSFRRNDLLHSPDRLNPNWTPHPPQVRVLSAEQWQDFLINLGKKEIRNTPPIAPQPSTHNYSNSPINPSRPSWSNPSSGNPSSGNPSSGTPGTGAYAAGGSEQSNTEVWFAAGDEKPFQQSRLSMLTRKCDAVGVGLLAARAFRLGITTDPLALLPRYLKPSAAEEKANQKLD